MFKKAKLLDSPRLLEIMPEAPAPDSGRPADIIINRGGGRLRSLELDIEPDESGLRHGALFIRHTHSAVAMREESRRLNGMPHSGLVFEPDRVDEAKGVCRIKFTVDTRSRYNDPDRLKRVLYEALLVDKASGLRSFTASANALDKKSPSRF
jgi:hypothetical protein